MVVTAGMIAAGIGALGAVGSAGLGIVNSNASSKRQYKYQSRLQAQAAQLNYDYSKLSTLNSPAWTREGLESAGYNPMLAVQNGTSGANASFTSAGQAQNVDYNTGITQAVSNAQSFQRLQNETNLAESQSKANEATAENQVSMASNNIEENKWISEKRKKEIANIQADTMEKEARIDNMKKQIELGFAGINVQQEANAISAIGKEEYADRAKRYKEWGEKHPYLRNIDETITRYFNGIGANVGSYKKVK